MSSAKTETAVVTDDQAAGDGFRVVQRIILLSTRTPTPSRSTSRRVSSARSP